MANNYLIDYMEKNKQKLPKWFEGELYTEGSVVTNPYSLNRNFYPNRENPTELNRTIAKHKVEEGELLIFPAYLPHQVLPNESDEDRIVISFNLWIQR